MSSKDKYKKLGVNTLIFAIANIGSKIVNFLLVPLYTNVLSRGEYGTAELVINCTSIVIPIVSLSISNSLLRFGLDKKLNVNTVFKNSSLVLLLGSFICFLLTPLFSTYSGIGEWAFVFSILCITQMIRNSFTLFTKTIERNELFAADAVIYTFSLGILNIIFLTVFKLGVHGYLWAYVCANIISTVFIGIRANAVNRILTSKADWLLLQKMLKYSIPMIVNALSWWVIHFSDRVMLEQMASVQEVGLYSAAAKIPNILSILLSVFTEAWTISSVLEYDNDRDERFYSNVFSFYIFGLCGLATIFLAVLKPFMQLYVGPDFKISWIYVPLLILASVYGAISTFVGPLYSAAKKNVAATITTIGGGVINIVFNYLLIRKYSIMGAVIATLIAETFMGIVRLFDTRRFFKFEIDFKRMWAALILVSIQAISVTTNCYSTAVSLFAIIAVFMIYKNTLFSFVSNCAGILKNMKR